MKIISQFKKLLRGSRISLKFRKYTTNIFLGSSSFEYGIEIFLNKGKIINKIYEKFSIQCEVHNELNKIIIYSKIENEDELNVFASLIEYILFKLGQKNNATSLDIIKYIEEWLNFSKKKSIELSIEKQIGLIGELTILSELINNIPETNHINNWCGPEGSKIDFIFSSKYGIEVKSRIQPFKDWIKISSIEQLDNELENQNLIVCDFLPSDTGKNIKQFVDDVISKLDDVENRNLLIEKLQKIKFDYFTNYSNLIKVSLFKITSYNTKDENFPKLKKNIDLRIDKVNYEININGLEKNNFSEVMTIVRNQQVFD